MLDRLSQGELRAPANGLIVKVLRRTGEHCKIGEPVVLLLDQDSLEVVLFVPPRGSPGVDQRGDSVSPVVS